MMNRSYAETANNFGLWGEYVDPYGTMPESDFLALSVADKVAIQQRAFGPEPDMYMNPSTGSVDTIDGWYPHGVDDGLVLVTRDADGSWVAA